MPEHLRPYVHRGTPPAGCNALSSCGRCRLSDIRLPKHRGILTASFDSCKLIWHGNVDFGKEDNETLLARIRMQKKPFTCDMLARSCCSTGAPPQVIKDFSAQCSWEEVSCCTLFADTRCKYRKESHKVILWQDLKWSPAQCLMARFVLITRPPGKKRRRRCKNNKPSPEFPWVSFLWAQAKTRASVQIGQQEQGHEWWRDYDDYCLTGGPKISIRIRQGPVQTHIMTRPLSYLQTELKQHTTNRSNQAGETGGNNEIARGLLSKDSRHLMVQNHLTTGTVGSNAYT